ncbi:MAG TPA: aquaporin [Acidimicrobiia bacterium]
MTAGTSETVQQLVALEPPSSKAFDDPKDQWRRLFAEVLGTFLLVLAAAGGPVVNAVSNGRISLSAQVVAPGLTVMAVIYFMGAISGAHLNPAVTLAFALRRNFPWRRVPGYIAAQLVGAVLAALLLRTMFGNVADLGATQPQRGIADLTVMVLEAVLSFGLVSVILGTASGARNIGANAALAVGGYIALAGLWAAPISGASMNPARSFGPALVGGHWTAFWAYVIGPLIGAGIAVAVGWILRGPPTKTESEAAQGSGTTKSSPRRRRAR